MRNELKHIYKNFLVRPDIWFFYGFLATLTLSIRKVMFFYPIGGQFNEYAGAYIYLSDIFLILTFLFWIILLCNELSILSISKTALSKTYKMFHPCLVGCSMWNILTRMKHSQKKNTNVSPITSAMFHVEHSQIKTTSSNVPRGTFSISKKTYTELIHNFTLYFPLIAVFFSFLSILWATNESIALFRSLKLLELSLLFYYLIYTIQRLTREMFHVEHLNQDDKFKENKYKCSACVQSNVPRGTLLLGWNIVSDRENFIKKLIKIVKKRFREMFHVEHFLKNILIIVITTSVTQSTIGLLQAFFQHSIGLYWLRESFISQNTAGVAKIILHGDAFVRAYGLFPHPNIFGGFLVFSIFCTLAYFHMFHVEHSNQNKKFFKQAIISIQILAILLTFSKSAVIALLIGLIYLHTKRKQQNVPRGTLLNYAAKKNHLCHEQCSTWNIFTDVEYAYWNGIFFKKIRAMFHVEHLLKKTFLIAAIFALLIITLKPDLNSIFIKSLNERELFLNVSRETFLMHPFLGIGAGQFVINMVQYYNLAPWQYQPVHNIFLLILNEFGIFLLLAFLYFLYRLLKTPNYSSGLISEHTKRGRSDINIYFRAIFISFIFVMLFDHYLWDIQQGQVMLWLIFGLAVGNSCNQSNKLKTD